MKLVRGGQGPHAGCWRFTRAKVQGVSVAVMRACGCGPLPRPLITGRDAERPSPESSPRVAVSGGRAAAQRSRPERPALTKSAGGPARDCGPPGAGATVGQLVDLGGHRAPLAVQPATKPPAPLESFRPA